MKVLIVLTLVGLALASKSCSKPEASSPKWACPLPRIGLTPECPATSCKRILELNPFAVDGKYFFHIGSDEVIFPAICDMTNGGWMLTMKIPKGWMPMNRNLTKPLEKITKPRTFTEILETVVDFNEGKIDQLMNPMFASFDIYKNRAWRFWDVLNVKKVRVGLKKAGRVVKHVEFDAVNADRFSWFTLDRLVKESFETMIPSWSDIRDNDSWMTIFKLARPTTPYRELALVDKHLPTTNFELDSIACDSRCGWFMAVNNFDDFRSELCPFEKTVEGFHVLYSTKTTKAMFNHAKHVDVADDVAIMLQF